MRRQHLTAIAICSIGLAVVLSFSYVREASAFNDPDLLTRRIKATEIKNKSIDDVLDLIAIDYAIPVGIELADPKRTSFRQIDLNLPETNLKDFLDVAIAKDPGYTWKLEGGVIHVWMVNARDTFVANLLNAKIIDLPEIRSQLIIADVGPMIVLNFGSMHKLEKGTVFDESDLTLRELLDKIAIKTSMKRWVLTRWGKNGEFITLRS